jgi:hypothetical protein
MPSFATLKLVFLAGVSLLLLGVRAAGAQPAEAPSSGSAECFPTCREGFVCHQGQCVSECNPPCPRGQVCVQGQYCEPSEGAGAYEPPPPGAPAGEGVYEPPPPPKPPGFERRVHSALAFHMGFGGDVEADGARQDLVSTLGVNLRTDFPVAKYILLGPLFQLGAWRPDMPNPPSRSYYFDIDFFARARIPITTDSTAFQIWLGVPIGLTLSFLSADYEAAFDTFAFGYNFGFLAGGAVHFSKKFGMFVEAGWMTHRVSHDRAPTAGSARFEVSQNVANFGFIFGG